MQQRAGVQLKGGVGQVGDVYEQNADAVADRVVAGRSAQDLLFAGDQAQSSVGVQCNRTSQSQTFGSSQRTEIRLSKTFIQFPRTKIGEHSAPIQVTIANVGAGPVTIDDISNANGNIPAELGVLNFKQATSLDAEENLPLRIRFSPTTGGDFTDTIYVYVNGRAVASFVVAGVGDETLSTAFPFAKDEKPAPVATNHVESGPVRSKNSSGSGTPAHKQLARAANELTNVTTHLGRFSKAVDDLNSKPLLSLAAQVVKSWKAAKVTHRNAFDKATLGGDLTMFQSADAMKRRFEVVRGSIERVIGLNAFKGKSALGYLKPMVGDVATHVASEAAKLQKIVLLLKQMRKAWFLEQTSKKKPERTKVVGKLQALQLVDFEQWLFIKYVMVSGNYWSGYKGVKGPDGRTLEGSALKHGASFGDLMEGVGDELGTVAKELPGAIVNTLDPRNIACDLQGYMREAVHGGKPHKACWPVNQGFDPLVRQPVKSANAIAGALASALDAISKGDTHKLGVAIVMIGSVFVPGMGEVKLADSVAKLARIEKRILERLKAPLGAEKIHLKTQLSRVQALMRRGRKLSNSKGTHVPGKHLEPDAWTRHETYHAPDPTKTAKEVRETLNTDAKMMHPMPEGLSKAERLEVQKKRTAYFGEIERQAIAEQKRLKQRLARATPGSNEHSRLRAETVAASKLEQAAQVKPLGGPYELKIVGKKNGAKKGPPPLMQSLDALSASERKRHNAILVKQSAELTEVEAERLFALRQKAGISDIGAKAGEPEHKASRWNDYKTRKAVQGQTPLPYKQWSNVYAGNMIKAKKAHAAADGVHAKLGWGNREVTVKVGGQTRRLDIADVPTMRAVEVKTGYVANTNPDIVSEIARDKLLVRDGWAITWHIDGRASAQVREALAKPPPIKLVETKPDTPIKDFRSK